MPKAIIDIETLTGIGDAVREKAGSAEGIPVPALENAIREIPSGGGSAGVSAKAVNFYDYEGTILHSYTKDEFLALTEMPELPTRPGLICQGWNNTLEYMQEYTSEYGVCDAGATYITDDGATRIYVTLTDGRTSPALCVCVNGTLTVDWGDDSEPDVLTGTSTGPVIYTPNHTYEEPGDYVIRLIVEGEFRIDGSQDNAFLVGDTTSRKRTKNQGYLNSVNSVEIGSGISNISSIFCRCTNLTSVSIPNSVTSVGSYAFDDCYNLAYVVIPNSVTSIGKFTFNRCYGLERVIIPNGVASISESIFNSCYGLVDVIIPSSVTSIDANVFSQCSNLTSVSIPNSVTNISSYAFKQCCNLASVVIPNSVTSVTGNMFFNCFILAVIDIPDSVTSIGSSAFYQCRNLAYVVIPNSVTNIGNNAFYDCFGVAFYDLSAHTSVPTLGGSLAFSGIPADCEIRVPAALYDEWIAATNWSTYAANIVAV